MPTRACSLSASRRWTTRFPAKALISRPYTRSPAVRSGALHGAAAVLFAAGIAARTRGQILWCITCPDLFAPALAQAGLDPDRVIIVEAGDEGPLLACC